jgi:flagellar biosynthetic protein FliR
MAGKLGYLRTVPSLISALADGFARSGVDLARLGLAWARAAPSVAIVPAFGLRALPTAARGVLGLALAAAIFPALPAIADGGAPWPLLALREMALGLPIAIAAAVPLWAATMAGGVADALRGSASSSVSSPTVEAGATPLGVAMSLLASAFFLASGGPARVAGVLALRATAGHPALAAMQDLAGGITLAVAVGGPLLAASIVIEVAGALVARAASPAQLHLLLAPLRALCLLAVMAVVFDRMALVLLAAVEHAPLHLSGPA